MASLKVGDVHKLWQKVGPRNREPFLSGWRACASASGVPNAMEFTPSAETLAAFQAALERHDITVASVSTEKRPQGQFARKRGTLKQSRKEALQRGATSDAAKFDAAITALENVDFDFAFDLVLPAAAGGGDADPGGGGAQAAASCLLSGQHAVARPPLAQLTNGGGGGGGAEMQRSSGSLPPPGLPELDGSSGGGPSGGVGGGLPCQQVDALTEDEQLLDGQETWGDEDFADGGWVQSGDDQEDSRGSSDAPPQPPEQSGLGVHSSGSSAAPLLPDQCGKGAHASGSGAAPPPPPPEPHTTLSLQVAQPPLHVVAEQLYSAQGEAGNLHGLTAHACALGQSVPGPGDTAAWMTLLTQLTSTPVPAQLQAAEAVCRHAPSVPVVLRAAASAQLTGLLPSPHPALQLQGVRALGALAAEGEAAAAAVRQADVIAPLTKLLLLQEGSNVALQEAVLTLLTKLCGHDSCRDQVSDAGCMSALCGLLSHSQPSVQAAALALMQTLCSSRDACVRLLECGAASPLAATLGQISTSSTENDESVTHATLECLQALSQAGLPQTQTSVRNAGGAPHLIELASHSSPRVSQLAASLVSVLCPGDVHASEQLSESGGLVMLEGELQSGDEQQQLQAVSALAQLPTQPQQAAAIVELLRSPHVSVQRQAVRWLVALGEAAAQQADAIVPLTTLLLPSASAEVRQEAALAIAPIVRGEWRLVFDVGGFQALLGVAVVGSEAAQQDVLRLAVALMDDSNQRKALLSDESSISAIVQLLASPSLETQGSAAEALVALSQEDAACAVLHRLGSLSQIRDALAASSLQQEPGGLCEESIGATVVEVRAALVGLAARLAADDRCEEPLDLLGNGDLFAPLLSVLKSSSSSAGAKYNAVSAIRSLTLTESGRDKLRSAGGLDALGTALPLATCEKLQVITCRVLANFKGEEYGIEMRQMLESGATTALVGMLQSPNVALQEAALALLTMLCSHDSCRDQVADARCVRVLCGLLSPSQPSVQAAALALLQTLSSSRNVCVKLLECGAAPALAAMLGQISTSSTENDEIAAATLECLQALSRAGRPQTETAVRHAGGARHVIELASHSSARVSQLAASLVPSLCPVDVEAAQQGRLLCTGCGQYCHVDAAAQLRSRQPFNTRCPDCKTVFPPLTFYRGNDGGGGNAAPINVGGGEQLQADSGPILPSPHSGAEDAPAGAAEKPSAVYDNDCQQMTAGGSATSDAPVECSRQQYDKRLEEVLGLAKAAREMRRAAVAKQNAIELGGQACSAAAALAGLPGQTPANGFAFGEAFRRQKQEAAAGSLPRPMPPPTATPEDVLQAQAQEVLSSLNGTLAPADRAGVLEQYGLGPPAVETPDVLRMLSDAASSPRTQREILVGLLLRLDSAAPPASASTTTTTYTTSTTATNTTKTATASIPVSETPRGPAPAEALTLCHWNVNGLKGLLENAERKELLVELVAAERPNLLALSEHKVSEESVDQVEMALLSALPCEYVAIWVTSAKKGYSGVVVLVEKGTKVTSVALDQVDELDEGRTITIELDHLFVVTTYVPNSGQGLKRLNHRVDVWDPALRAHVQQLQLTKPVVLQGDLNVAHRDADIWNAGASHIPKMAGATQRERDSFSKLLGTGLADCFRVLSPATTNAFSFWTPNNRAQNRGLRLDYALASDELAGGGGGPLVLNSCRMLECFAPKGDHCPVVVRFTPGAQADAVVQADAAVPAVVQGEQQQQSGGGVALHSKNQLQQLLVGRRGNKPSVGSGVAREDARKVRRQMRIDAAKQAAPFTGDGLGGAAQALPRSCILVSFDVEHLGGQKGDKALDYILYEIGFVIRVRSDGKWGPIEKQIQSYVKDGVVMVTSKWDFGYYVRERMLPNRTDYALGTLFDQLQRAPRLSEVVRDRLVPSLTELRRTHDVPVILAAHNGFSVDWPPLFTTLLLELGGGAALDLLREGGISSVMDSYLVVKTMPDLMVQQLQRTKSGRPSFSNTSLAMTHARETLDGEGVTHEALFDCRMSDGWTAADTMQPVLNDDAAVIASGGIVAVQLAAEAIRSRAADESSLSISALVRRASGGGGGEDDDGEGEDDDDRYELYETPLTRLRSGATAIPEGPPPAISNGLEVLCTQFQDAAGVYGEFGAPCRCTVRSVDAGKQTVTIVYTDTDACSDVPFAALAQAGWDDGPFEGVSAALAKAISKGACAQLHEHRDALLVAPQVEIEAGALDMELWPSDKLSEAAHSLGEAVQEKLRGETVGAAELVGGEIVRRLSLRPGASLQLLNALLRIVRPSVQALLWADESHELRSLANMVGESACAFAGAVGASMCAQLIDHLPHGGCRPESVSLVPNWPLALLYDEKEHILIAHTMDFLIATLAEKAGTAGFDSSTGKQTIQLLAWLQRELQVLLGESLLQVPGVNGRPKMLRALLKQRDGTLKLWQLLTAETKVICLICRAIGARLYHDPLGELCGPLAGAYSGPWLRHRLEAYHLRCAPLTAIQDGSALERLVCRHHGGCPIEALMALRCGVGDLWIHCVDSKNLMCEVVSALGYRAGVLDAALSTLTYVSLMERQLPPKADVIQDSTTVTMGAMMGFVQHLCERRPEDSATRLLKEAHETDGISTALSLNREIQAVLGEYRSRGALRPWQSSIGGVFAVAPRQAASGLAGSSTGAGSGGGGGCLRRRRALFRTLQLPRHEAGSDGCELESAAAAALGVGQRYRPRLIALAGGHVQTGQLPDTIWAVLAVFKATGAPIQYNESFGSAIFVSLEHSDAAAQHAIARRHEGTLHSPIDAAAMLEPYRSLIETVLADQHRRLLLRLPSGSGGRAAGQEVQPLVSVYGVEEPPASLSVGSRVEAVFDAHDIKKRDILEDDWCPGVISAVNEDDVSGELTYDIAFDPDSSNPEGDQQEGVSAGHIRIPISPSERSKRKRVEQAEAAAATKARAAQEAAQDAAVGKRGHTMRDFFGGHADTQKRARAETAAAAQMAVSRLPLAIDMAELAPRPLPVAIGTGGSGATHASPSLALPPPSAPSPLPPPAPPPAAAPLSSELEEEEEEEDDYAAIIRAQQAATEAARESKRKIDELQMQQQRSVSAKAGEGTSSRSIMDMFAASTAASSAEPSQTEGEDDDGPAIRAAQLLALQGNAQMATFGFSMDSIDD